MPALRIQTNTPEQVRLLSLDAETAASNFGQDQLRFRTDRGDLYVSVAVGNILLEAIAKQGIKAGEPVEIAKREVAIGSRKTIRWELTRPGREPQAPRDKTGLGSAVGEQPDGSFAISAPPAKPPSVETGVSSALFSYTTGLIDAYAAAVRYANEKHSGVVTPERVWSIFATVVIGQQQRNGNGVKNHAA